MSGYAKVFASMFTGSMRGQSDAQLVMVFLIAHAHNGVTDCHFRAISDATGLSVARVTEAITYLEGPDPESRSPAEDGRRIVRLNAHRNWGWRIVNHEHYRNLMSSSEDIYHQKYREKQQRYRDRKSLRNVTSRYVTPESESVLCTESKGVQGEREANGSSGTIPTFEEVKEYAAGHAVTFVVAQKFFDYYQGKNLWLNKHGRLVNWHYEIIVWQNNERSRVSPNGFHQPAPKAEIDKELAASRRWIDNWKMPESLL